MSDIRNALQKGAANVINGYANQLRIQIEENDVLRAELAAALGRMSKLDFERTAAELERDALRALLREAYEWRDTLWPVSTTVRIAAALKEPQP